MSSRFVAPIVFAVAILLADCACAEIVGGTVNIYQCPFDFSTQSCASNVDSMDASVVNDTGCWFLYTCHSRPASMVALILGKTLGDVCGPPADPAWFCGTSADWCLQGNEVFLIHTGDGYWVKCAFVNFNRPWPDCWEIIYFLQTDGTSNLCSVPVEPTTWGEIKAVFE